MEPDVVSVEQPTIIETEAFGLLRYLPLLRNDAPRDKYSQLGINLCAYFC